MLTHVRLNVTREEAAILFAEFDANGAGYITSLEFETGFHHIEDLIIELAMETLGLSKEVIYKKLMFGIAYLVAFSIFLFLGVSAFTTGTTFGSVINSIIPIIASSAVFQGDAPSKIIGKASEIKNAALKAFKQMRAKSAT